MSMPWLEKLIVAGSSETKDNAPTRVAHTRKKPRPTVHQVIVQVRPQSENDPGQITIGHYIVDDGMLELTDENGMALGKSITLRTGADAKVIAHKLTRERWLEKRDGFNRPLEYSKIHQA